MRGTLFPALESETGFQLRLMKQMGYDAIGPGNHEFDFGPQWLAGIIKISASGIRVEYNPEKGFLKKIEKIDILHSGERVISVDFDRKNKTLYSITADSYMLEFIGIIRKMSFGIINVVPKDSEGNKVSDMKRAIIDMDESSDGVQEGKEWLAMISFLSSMHDMNGNGIPDIDKKYSFPVKCFYPVKVR